MTPPARVNPDVVAVRADPVDLADLDEQHAIALAYDDAVHRRGRRVGSIGVPGDSLFRSERGSNVVHQRREAARDTAFLPFHYTVPRALDRRREPHVVDRLEEVVERVRLEGLERM